jgi:hypothetical protein
LDAVWLKWMLEVFEEIQGRENLSKPKITLLVSAGKAKDSLMW